MSCFNTINDKIPQTDETLDASNYNNQSWYPQQDYNQQYYNQQYNNYYTNQSYDQYQQQQYLQQQYQYLQQQQYHQQYQDQLNCQIPQINIPYQKINVSMKNQESINYKLNNPNTLPSYVKEDKSDKSYLNVPNSPCIIKIEGDGNILSNNNYQLKHNNIKIDDTNFKVSNSNSNINDSKLKINIVDNNIADNNIADNDIKLKINIDSNIEDNKIDDELLKAEYIVISKIYDDNKLKYIKAINKNGQKVLINIDENNNNFSKKREAKSDKLPYNIKTSALNCINNVICGVALQCGNDEICIINKDSKDLKIKESLYDYNENNDDDKTNDDLIVYPVIKLSEIKLNPRDLLVNTDVATARLQNMTYNTQLENLGTTSVELNKLNNTFNKFNILREEITDKLKISLKQLKEINNKYTNDKQLIENNKDLYKQVQKNLLIREENMMKLSNYIKKFADKKTQLEIINNELDTIINNCAKNFENIELVL